MRFVYFLTLVIVFFLRENRCKNANVYSDNVPLTKVLQVFDISFRRAMRNSSTEMAITDTS